MESDLLACYRCKRPVDGVGTIRCLQCSATMEVGDDRIEAKSDSLMAQAYGERYRLWRLLQNNGVIAYLTHPPSSLSVDTRADVRAFADMLAAYRGRVLDVGAGPLELPGYLQPLVGAAGTTLYGLDPLPPLQGAARKRYIQVTSYSEMMPFRDHAFDVIVYGTSLDHSVAPLDSLRESHRVLRPGGGVVVWMSDNSKSRRRRWKAGWRRFARRLRGRNVVQTVDDSLMLLVPAGAVDAFHTYHEDPATVAGWLAQAGFRNVTTDYRDRDHVYLRAAR